MRSSRWYSRMTTVFDKSLTAPSMDVLDLIHSQREANYGSGVPEADRGRGV